jgi:hypothetical protein
MARLSPGDLTSILTIRLAPARNLVTWRPVANFLVCGSKREL